MNEVCNKLHCIFNNVERFNFPFDKNKIPENGIYVLFEKGEKGHGLDRIVRIGTHKGNNKLRSRLFEHFLNENKDRSIFRKNIGRALLNKEKDLFLKIWELDLTARKARNEFSREIDFVKQKEIEKKVSERIQGTFSFTVFEVPEKDKRLKFESKLISTISLCEECYPSKDWLGLFSPLDKIRESGLWQVNELYKNPLNENEFNELRKLIK